jgi:hypothetical protein
MTVKDLLNVLCKCQWIEIAGDRYSESPHFVGTVKDLMSDNEYEFFAREKVNGVFSEAEDKSHYILVYYNDSELGQV